MSAPRFLTDEDFNNRILRGLLRRHSGLDIVRVQDTRVFEADDPAVLAWGAQNQRVILTHDARTMPHHATVRLRDGYSIAGLIVVAQSLPIGAAIDELLLINECSTDLEWIDQIQYIPL